MKNYTNIEEVAKASIGFLALACLLTMIGCRHIETNNPSSVYSLDGLLIDTNDAVKLELGQYSNYKGKVIKISSIYGLVWGDYTRPVYLDLDDCSGLFEIIVSMSVLVEKPAVEKPPPAAKKQLISAYKPEPVAQVSFVDVIESIIEYNGPANIGWTLQNGDRGYQQFGGNAIAVPEGEWVDLNFSQVIDIADTGTRQVFIDGLNDHQGLVDLILYIRHFGVTKRKVTEGIFEVMIDELIEELTEG